MNQEIFRLFGLSVSIVCYGLLTVGFLCFLKAHFKITKINQGLFALLLFTGLIVMGILFHRGVRFDGPCRIMENLLFSGLVILAFSGAWEKKLLAAAILIAAEKLVANFCASFLTALTLVVRHGILKQSAMLEAWQDSFIIFLSYLATVAVLYLLAGKTGSLFEEKAGKWYLMGAGPLFFMILVIDVYNWSVGRGVIFWDGNSMELYENQLFSHGAVCVLTAVCMFAAGFYVYGMQKIHEEWQKKEQYRLQVVYLEGLKNQNERMDKIRHDMKNHIISLQGLLAGGNPEKLGEYLDRMAQPGGIKGTEEVTGNIAVDALLYEKQKRAKEKNVDWQCDMQPWKESVLDEFDFCVLAGNALDNAIEACERMEDEETENRRIENKTKRFLRIQTGWVKNYFLFEVKNSVGAKDGKEQDSASDKRKNRRKHCGIGLLNIKETVEKYNGIVNTEWKDGVFILSVLIPIEQLVPDKETLT